MKNNVVKAMRNTFPGKILLIGIAGGSGAAKSTITDSIVRVTGTGNVAIVKSDNYYQDLSNMSFEKRCQTNFDHPDSIEFSLMAQRLVELKNGHSIEMPEYDFTTHNRKKTTITIPSQLIIIVEGILIFAVPEIRNLLDIRIFIHADPDERFIRRLQRDTTERGRTKESVQSQWRKTVKPMHMRYVNPSQDYAHLTLHSRYKEGYSVVTATLLPFILLWLEMHS